jgi:hypothetical protein
MESHMPIKSEWGNPQKTVIHSVFDPIWTLDEYHAMIDTMHKMVISVDHRVHFISDFSNSNASPAKLLSTGRHIENTMTENSGINVIVNASGFLKAMANVSQRLFLKDVQLYFANSLEEAYQIVEKHEQTHARR